MNSQLAVKQNQTRDTAKLLEKVLTTGDIEGLTPEETNRFIEEMCSSLGLNAITSPIGVIPFQGKKKLYFKKEATEQLRVLRKISIRITENKIIDDLYIVVAEATSPDGRVDSSTGAISIQGLKGEAKANAIMKAETKAKRRVTLSICGLGFNDESEMDFTKNEPKQKLVSNVPVNKQLNSESNDNLDNDFNDMLAAINKCDTIEQLKAIFDEVKKIDFTSKPDYLRKLIDAKDQKKNEFMVAEFNSEIDSTGEVI